MVCTVYFNSVSESDRLVLQWFDAVG